MEMSRHVLSFCVSDVELLCGQIDHTLSLKQGWRGVGRLVCKGPDHNILVFAGHSSVSLLFNSDASKKSIDGSPSVGLAVL